MNNTSRTDDGKTCGAIILAGGKSSRMKAPKSWLPIPGNTTFIEQIADTFHLALNGGVIAVLNGSFCIDEFEPLVQRLKLSSQVIPNHNPELGRLHSIKLGLQHLNDDYVFIQNTDSPFLQVSTIEYLMEHAKAGSVCIPVFNSHRGHPVLMEANWLRNAIQAAPENSTLRDLISTVELIEVHVNDPAILDNINSPEQYEQLMHERVE
ncbi:MAG: nucleotidyltransferase family protein [Crocinitomicaceae bacterium]|nr:nucleotidyltransferase family protein [Crocinitomicaceae bacterium]MBK8924498.1 nucleotidyltransferase family protein [Crocinitomicaceae bacterium]